MLFRHHAIDQSPEGGAARTADRESGVENTGTRVAALFCHGRRLEGITGLYDANFGSLSETAYDTLKTAYEDVFHELDLLKTNWAETREADTDISTASPGSADVDDDESKKNKLIGQLHGHIMRTLFPSH